MREMTGIPIEAPAATRNPVDRIKELDRQGVREALVYPTLANLVEHSAAENPELTMAIIHALNEWMLRDLELHLRRPAVHDAGDQLRRGRQRPA